VADKFTVGDMTRAIMVFYAEVRAKNLARSTPTEGVLA
jgi:hypothetical protein